MKYNIIANPSAAAVQQNTAIATGQQNLDYIIDSVHNHNSLDHNNDKLYNTKQELNQHNQIQHIRESKPYKCTQCIKTFANSSYLSQHTRIHLGIKPYRCEICQRKFTQLSHLQQHIRTHTGDKPYKCRHINCNKAFSQLSNLQSHSRCHQTDKPYKCNSCYKCFIDENSLLDHIPKHKESKHLKTHICPFCGKSYTQETYLNKHMLKHEQGGQGGGDSGVASGKSGGGSGGKKNKSALQQQQQTPAAVQPTVQIIQDYWKNLSEINPQQPQQPPQSPQQQQQQQPDEVTDLRIIGQYNENLISVLKTTSSGGGGSSAFTPISSSTLGSSPFHATMLQLQQQQPPPLPGGQQQPAPGQRLQYLQYESHPASASALAATTTFLQQQHKDSKFPNQLISLHQIRNYQPMLQQQQHQNITIEHLIKEK